MTADDNLPQRLASLQAELDDSKTMCAALLEHSTAIEEELDRRNLELKRLSEKLSLYLAPQVYDAIFSGARDVTVHAHRRKLTIFFADVVGFSHIAEDLEPEDLSKLLNEYLTEVTSIAERHGATVNKYIGDAVVAFFGDPQTAGEQEDALRCVEMAIDIQRSLHELRKVWDRRGVEHPFHCRIGINTGYCTVGNFGSARRMDYTAIGREVNLAARIQAMAETDGILISHATRALVQDRYPVVEQEPAMLKGFPRPVRLYRVVMD
jgi:class 3 adenylate cyclase